jgi:MFS transporter, ACS family, D-galactonate transporter
VQEEMTNIRWRILAVMALGNAINFLDRTSLGIAMPFIRHDLDLTAVQAGYAFSALLLTYAPTLVLGGILADRYGPRRLAAGATAAWSVMTGLIGAAQSWTGLILCRSLLGAFQSGATPSWAKATSRWFPQEERGLAVSIYDSGIRIGSVLSVPVMAALISWFGWRWAFVAIGAVGLLWVPLWLAIYRDPRMHPGANAAELAHVERGGAARDNSSNAQKVRWIDLFRFPTTWGIVLVAFFAGGQVYFFLNWLPTYLMTVRHFSLLKEGWLGTVPLVASALGGVAGGIVGDMLVRRGYGLNAARKSCILFGLMLASCTSSAAWLDDTALIILLLSTGMFANAFASVSIFTLPLDVSPVAERTASLSAIQMAGTMAGGLAYPLLVGYMLEWTGGDFAIPIIGSGIVALIAVVIFLALVRNIAPLPIHCRGGATIASPTVAGPFGR